MARADALFCIGTAMSLLLSGTLAASGGRSVRGHAPLLRDLRGRRKRFLTSSPNQHSLYRMAELCKGYKSCGDSGFMVFRRLQVTLARSPLDGVNGVLIMCSRQGYTAV